MEDKIIIEWSNFGKDGSVTIEGGICDIVVKNIICPLVGVAVGCAVHRYIENNKKSLGWYKF